VLTQFARDAYEPAPLDPQEPAEAFGVEGVRAPFKAIHINPVRNTSNLFPWKYLLLKERSLDRFGDGYNRGDARERPAVQALQWAFEVARQYQRSVASARGECRQQIIARNVRMNYLYPVQPGSLRKLYGALHIQGVPQRKLEYALPRNAL
jgi:hypothetical protein